MADLLACVTPVAAPRAAGVAGTTSQLAVVSAEPPNDALTPADEIGSAQLREALGFRPPMTLQVHRNLRQAGALDPSGESSRARLSADSDETLSWAFDGAAGFLVSGHQLRSSNLCMDGRERFHPEWFALAPLLAKSADAFRLLRVAGSTGADRFVAIPRFPEADRSATRVHYRALDPEPGFEIVVAQTWHGAGRRWRTFRYELHPRSAVPADNPTKALAPCAASPAAPSQ